MKLKAKKTAGSPKVTLGKTKVCGVQPQGTTDLSYFMIIQQLLRQ